MDELNTNNGRKLIEASQLLTLQSRKCLAKYVCRLVNLKQHMQQLHIVRLKRKSFQKIRGQTQVYPRATCHQKLAISLTTPLGSQDTLRTEPT